MSTKLKKSGKSFDLITIGFSGAAPVNIIAVHLLCVYINDYNARDPYFTGCSIDQVQNNAN